MRAGRRFELRRELGSGAFGTVYLAEMVSQGGFRRQAALKVLNERWEVDGDIGSKPGHDAGRRLRDEARLLGRLRHPHIVRVDDLVRVDGRWAVVMEYVPGLDLEGVLRALHGWGEPFPPAAAAGITGAVATALDEAWRHSPEGEEPLRVVHRDIKPSNIRLTARAEVKVLDFGIALATFSERETQTGSVRHGTIRYMAPERLLGEVEVPAGDIYSLGVVLYEMLALAPLGRAELAPDRQAAQVEAALGRLAERADAGAIGPLVELLKEMLAYEADARPSAEEVARRARSLSRGLPGEDLQAFAERVVPRVDLPPKPVEGVLTEELSGEDTVVPALALPVEPPAKARSPGRVLALSALLGLVLVSGLGGTAILLRGGEEAPRARVPPPLPEVEDPAPAPVQVVSQPLVEPPAPEEPPPAPEEPPRAEAKVQAPAPPRAEPTPPTEPEPQPEPETPSSGEILRRVKFSTPGASRILARCGAVSGQGTSTVLLLDVPAGRCTVEATVDGSTRRGSANARFPTAFDCLPEGGELSCRSSR